MRFVAPLMMIALLAGCHKAADPVATPQPLAVEAVQVLSADSGALGNSTAATPATIVHDRESVLSFRVGGTITALHAHLGDHLARGALVAALDATAYHAAVARAEADVARLSRADQRNSELLAAGAIAAADRQDTQSALSAARAAATNAHYDLHSAQLHMPFPGVILSKTVELGATVAPGQSLVSVADTRTPMVARAQVAPALAHVLRRGMSAQVQSADRSTPLNGHILRISAANDPRTGTIEVDVALDGAPQIASGTTGSVVFANGSATSNATAVARQIIPAEALIDNDHGNGHVYIFDKRPAVARLMPVHVIGMDGENVTVSGLATDVRVITAGAGFVADGQPITVQGK